MENAGGDPPAFADPVRPMAGAYLFLFFFFLAFLPAVP